MVSSHSPAFVICLPHDTHLRKDSSFPLNSASMEASIHVPFLDEPGCEVTLGNLRFPVVWIMSQAISFRGSHSERPSLKLLTIPLAHPGEACWPHGVATSGNRGVLPGASPLQLPRFGFFTLKTSSHQVWDLESQGQGFHSGFQPGVPC